MKTYAAILLLLLAAAASGEDAPFRVGEKLGYRIYWGPFEAGHATLEVAGIETVDGHDCYHLVVRAKTTGFVDMLFHVDNIMESWLDVKELRTVRYRQHRIEGKHTKRSETCYDYTNKRYTITNHLNGATYTLPLDQPLQDIVSAAYYVRTQPLALHRSLEFFVNAGDTNRRVRFLPDQRKKIWTNPLGDVPALRVEPNPTLTVVAANKGRMWIWISDDAQKLPLVVISKLAIGSARFQLTEVKAADPALAQRLRIASRN
ncbi:MAG: DUF3108 domain-containing protein [Verrucomicrobia bacterium]|nr:DUF3108 domain-containing protein [Verrucomicrobiota bacterium]